MWLEKTSAASQTEKPLEKRSEACADAHIKCVMPDMFGPGI
jgi:hypothetical protein